MNPESHYLSPEVRFYIVAQVTLGSKYEDIIGFVEQKFKITVAKSTISKIYSKYLEDGSVLDRPKTGRPPKLSFQQEAKVIKAAQQDRKLTARSIANSPRFNPTNASETTIQRILNRSGLIDSTSVPVTLSEEDMNNRLGFACVCQSKKLNWNYVIFSDECDIFPDKQGKNHYRKYRGEYVDISFGPEYRWDPRKIKVWGAISEKGVGTLLRYEGTITSDNYIQLLDYRLVKDFPFLKGTSARASKYLFQQDNAGLTEVMM